MPSDGADPQHRPGRRDVVLHVRCVTGAGGGPDKTILLSAAPLQSTRYFAAAALLHPPGDRGFAVLRRRARLQRCPLIEVRDRGPLDPTVPLRLLRICALLNVRIWHAHEYKSNLIGLLLRPLHRMKLVTTLHGWVRHTRRTRLYYAVDRACLRAYDHAISVSAELDDAAARLGVPRERRTLLRNAVDEQVFRRRVPAPSAPLRLRRDWPGGRFVVGAAGRLSDEKGFDGLVRAASALLASGVDAELWIAGEGEARRELQASIDACGLGGRVKLLGFVDDIIELYEASDVFVLSSMREGLPNVLLEAMAMQVAVVAAAVAGVPEVVRHGENGLLYPPGDVTALSERIRLLLTDEALRQRLARAARRTIEERFTFASRAAAEEQIYDRLLGG